MRLFFYALFAAYPGNIGFPRAATWNEIICRSVLFADFL
ncbi:hypothetical protein O206_12845 [Ochrobactrum sp. EGD-AQ16]|nr:hypothetical protein O206_12845 [Ochrobactrum sp. EGD-AQ16]